MFQAKSIREKNGDKANESASEKTSNSYIDIFESVHRKGARGTIDSF